MGDLILRAEPRTVLGKQVKQLRRAGRLPGVVYGPLLGGTHSVTVDTRELTRFYQTFGGSTLFSLVWKGGREQVFIREVQVDPVRHTAVHVDFFAPNLRKDVSATVPLVFSEENDLAEGILQTNLTEISVTGLPALIPAALEVDVSGLIAIHDAVRVSDLVLPEGISVALDPEEIVANRIAEAAPEAEPEVEAAEGEAADGESAEGEGADGADTEASADADGDTDSR